MSFRIVVGRDTLRFAAAHFATYGGDLEPLHGHNYALIVEIEGELTDDSLVLDFGDVKEIGRRLCKELHHRLLLQMRSPLLHIAHRDGAFEVRFGDRRYVVPEKDVVAMEIDNTTAERLAEWFTRRVEIEVSALGSANLSLIRAGVEEMPGQSGWHERRLPARGG